MPEQDKDKLYEGDKIVGRFQVLDAETDKPAALSEPPVFYVRYPGGESDPEPASEIETGWWRFTYATTTHGPHVVLTESPEPWGKTEVVEVYVHRLPTPVLN
jgi:hypothetical protein